MTRLRRVLGGRDLVLFYAVTSFSIRWIPAAAAAGPQALTVWAIAWAAFFVPLVYCVSRLSALAPEEGGLYVWTRKAFGDGAGFVAGWSYWSSNLPFFPSLLYFAAANALFIGGPGWQAYSGSASYHVAASLCGLALAAAFSIAGLGAGRWLHNAGAIGCWVPALLLIGLTPAVWLRHGSATELSWQALAPSGQLKDLVFWSSIAFAFSGVESASVLAGEVRDPARSIPRALLWAGAIMTALYIGGTLSVLVAVGPREVSGLQGFTQALDAAASRIGLRALVPWAAALVTLNALGAVAAWFAAAGRLPFVAGVDRFLPPAFARLHPRWGTPHVSLALQAAVSALFVVLSQAGTSVQGAYGVLVGMSVIVYFIPYLLMFAALVKLDRGAAAKALGGLGLLTTAASIVLAALPAEGDPNKPLAVAKTVGLSALLLALGAAVYRYKTSRRPRPAAAPRDVDAVEPRVGAAQ